MTEHDPNCTHRHRNATPLWPNATGATIALLGWLLLAGCPDTAVAPPGTAIANRVAPAATAHPELQRLEGAWVRPDGGYVLEVRSVAADGTVDAAYFNPRPIHVSVARADWFDGDAHLFVEFDDDNYRGSTYQLDRMADRDVLHGTYYQAEMGQTFEVVFIRRP
jgi:hypothetical protein